MEPNAELLAPVAFFAAIAFIVKFISDNRIKHKLIDKGMVNENLKYLNFKVNRIHPITQVKWSFLLIGIGMPLFLKQLFPGLLRDEGVVGLMFIFAGIGFFLYYLMARKELNKIERDK